MKKGVKRGIIAVVGVGAAIGLFFGGTMLVNTMRYRRIVDNIEISTPDLSRVADGTFNASFDAILVSADVSVTVESGVITEIVINDHHTGRDDARRAEVVIIDVVENQSLEVDTVSGATNSSLIILNAVQIALESGMN